MGGVTAARAIRASSDHNRRTPILALTATVLATQVTACHEAGMDGPNALNMAPIIERLAYVRAIGIDQYAWEGAVAPAFLLSVYTLTTARIWTCG